MSSEPPDANGAAESTPSRRRAIALAVATAAVAIAAITLYARRKRTLRLATGVRDGTFYALGLALQRSLEGSGVGLTILNTGGSEENLSLLQRGAAELALSSSAVPAVEGVSLVCPIGDELAQIIVRTSANVRSPSDLVGKRVSVGPLRSGTRFAALAVLAHFGLTERSFRALSLSPTAAKEAFIRGEIDALFLLSPLRDPVVDALLARGECELLSLGAPEEVGSALDGICASAPSFQRAVIPVLSYGVAPTRPVGTVRGTTYLLARNSLSDSAVARVTEMIFRDKVRLARVDPSLARMTEQFDRGVVTYPIHVGADQHYRRAEPSFLERYSDPISLAMSLLAVAWSAMNALRTARQRARLHRLDDVHRECAELEVRSRAARTEDARRAVYEGADDLRTRVFDQLVTGKFVADDAFRILVLRLDALVARNDGVPGMALAPVPLPEPPASAETPPEDGSAEKILRTSVDDRERGG